MYIELFILDNTLMNLLILTAAAALCQRPAGVLLRLAASLFGALYAAAALALAPVLLLFPCKLMLGAVMALSICKDVRRDYLSSLAALFAATLMVGGLVYALALAVGGSMEQGALYAGPTLRVWLVTALLGALAATLLPRLIRAWLANRAADGARVLVRLICGGRCYILRALVDTGNALCDPLSGLPVVIVPARCMPDSPLRPIPCSTVSGQCTLYACKPDSLQIRGKRWRDVHALIAAAPEPLKGADALICSQLAK